MKLYRELAEYYFEIERSARDIREDVKFILPLMGGRESPSLLDLGCGTGEHCALFAAEGFRCTGIDASEAMLAIARSRFPKGIAFINADMSDIDFHEAFDIIICLFGSFNYLLDDSVIISTLSKVRSALRPDGIGVFEIWNTIPVISIREKDVDTVSTTTVGEIVICRERGFRLIRKTRETLVEVLYRYRIDSPKGSKTLRDRHIMRTFTPDEIAGLLSNAGLTLKSLFSNFRSEPFRETSNKMVVVFSR